MRNNDREEMRNGSSLIIFNTVEFKFVYHETPGGGIKHWVSISEL